ncbi:hypothetical protein P4237_32060 [Pseudomonas aeruginosa]|nr:hypothetical protein [Pseudomonas aeruginosa]
MAKMWSSAPSCSTSSSTAPNGHSITSPKSLAVAGQALGVGEGGEAAQEQQVVAARQALEPLRRQLADVHAGAAGLQQQAEARLVALFVAQRRRRTG